MRYTMKRWMSCSILFGMICCLSAFGQEVQVIQANEKLIIKSTVLNEERNILVRLPANYDQSSARYPVLYMLDGQNPRINLMSGSVENLVAADMMPDMILVSIPNTDRQRDMTPSVVASQPGSGGADNFLRFLETELIPAIDAKYRVHPYRVIVGHSLSGLFVVYAFAARPEVFNAYIAASPHLQWDKHFILKKGEELLTPKKELRKTLFVGLGDEPTYLEGFNGFNELLKRLRIKNLDHEFIQLMAENHTSINAPVFHLGLRKVWSGLEIALTGLPVLRQVEQHYKAASIKYGYEIPIPENFLNLLGYRLLQSGNTAAAMEVFEKNISLYPTSANTYDSYSEALESTGQLKKAKENLETALKLAEKENNPALLNAIRENLRRVTRKLGN